MRINIINPFSVNTRKWLNTFKQFVDISRRIFWVCLTILWCWHLKGLRELKKPIRNGRRCLWTATLFFLLEKALYMIIHKNRQYYSSNNNDGKVKLLQKSITTRKFKLPIVIAKYEHAHFMNESSPEKCAVVILPYDQFNL